MQLKYVSKFPLSALIMMSTPSKVGNSAVSVTITSHQLLWDSQLNFFMGSKFFLFPSFCLLNLAINLTFVLMVNFESMLWKILPLFCQKYKGDFDQTCLMYRWHITLLLFTFS